MYVCRSEFFTNVTTTPQRNKLFSAKNDTLSYRRNTMPTISITSNDGPLESASAVLEVSATNPECNQQALHSLHQKEVKYG